MHAASAAADPSMQLNMLGHLTSGTMPLLLSSQTLLLDQQHLIVEYLLWMPQPVCQPRAGPSSSSKPQRGSYMPSASLLSAVTAWWVSMKAQARIIGASSHLPIQAFMQL